MKIARDLWTEHCLNVLKRYGHIHTFAPFNPIEDLSFSSFFSPIAIIAAHLQCIRIICLLDAFNNLFTHQSMSH